MQKWPKFRAALVYTVTWEARHKNSASGQTKLQEGSSPGIIPGDGQEARVSRYHEKKKHTGNLLELNGGQGWNRTTDTGIFRASKINNLLISLKQGFFGTIGDSFVDSVC